MLSLLSVGRVEATVNFSGCGLQQRVNDGEKVGVTP